MTDIYKPRFMNELASTGNPIVDAEMRSFKQNTTPLNGGTTQQDGAYALSGCNQTSRDGLGDSCERSMGGAEAVTLGAESMAVQGDAALPPHPYP